MTKHDDKFQKLAEARQVMRAGRQEVAAETVRALLKPMEASPSRPATSNEDRVEVQLSNSTLLWSDTVGANTVELSFLSSEDRRAATPLIEAVFSLDTEARTKLYRILSDSEKLRYVLSSTYSGD